MINSMISKTPPPNTRKLAKQKKEQMEFIWGKISDSSKNLSEQSYPSQPPVTYSRKRESSNSVLGEKSPFLKLIKEPLGQIAGTPFEFEQV
jgi:hypothetical protein